jgi:hypothetical protein
MVEGRLEHENVRFADPREPDYRGCQISALTVIGNLDPMSTPWPSGPQVHPYDLSRRTLEARPLIGTISRR